MSDQNMQQVSPPTEGELIDPGSKTKWPKVFGIISIVIAILGLLGQTCGVVWAMIGEWFMSLLGLTFFVPPIIKITSSVSYVFFLILGIILLKAGINLLRRRPGCLKLLKTWVVLRLIMALVSLVLVYVTLPANIAMQQSMMESMNELARKNGQPEQNFSENTFFTRAVVGAGLSMIITLIYPVVLGLYISRQKITDEVSEWGLGDDWEDD